MKRMVCFVAVTAFALLGAALAPSKSLGDSPAREQTPPWASPSYWQAQDETGGRVCHFPPRRDYVTSEVIDDEDWDYVGSLQNEDDGDNWQVYDEVDPSVDELVDDASGYDPYWACDEDDLIDYETRLNPYRNEPLYGFIDPVDTQNDEPCEQAEPVRETVHADAAMQRGEGDFFGDDSYDCLGYVKCITGEGDFYQQQAQAAAERPLPVDQCADYDSPEYHGVDDYYFGYQYECEYGFDCGYDCGYDYCPAPRSAGSAAQGGERGKAKLVEMLESVKDRSAVLLEQINNAICAMHAVCDRLAVEDAADSYDAAAEEGLRDEAVANAWQNEWDEYGLYEDNATSTVENDREAMLQLAATLDDMGTALKGLSRRLTRLADQGSRTWSAVDAAGDALQSRAPSEANAR